jgi:glutaredoxin
MTHRSILWTPRLACAVLLCITLPLAAACNRIDRSSGEGDAGAAIDATRPTGSDLTSLGPGAETRIYYQYIDVRGGVKFVERLDDVPEAWRDRVGYLELDAPPPLSPAEAKRTRDARYARANPGAGRSVSAGGGASAGREPEVLLYYADWCGYCTKAKRHLDRAGVDYVLRDVDNPHIKQELLEKTGQKGIPVIEVDGRIMKGYNAQRLDELIDSV